MPRPKSLKRDIDALMAQAEAFRAEMEADRAAIACPDPVAWAERALGFPLDTWQQTIMRSRHHRLVVIAARQSGKSVVTGAKTAFEAATRPGLRVVSVAPSFRQATLLADKIEAALHANGVPYTRQRERLTLDNGATVAILHGDRPGTLRGHTADLLLADELGFARADLGPAIFPMLGQSKGRLIAISSPNGPSGPLYDLSMQDGIELIRVPAREVSHFDPATIAELRGRLGPALARQELDAEFVASAASVFDADTLSAMFAVGPDLDPSEGEAAEAQELERLEAQRRAADLYACRYGVA